MGFLRRNRFTITGGALGLILWSTCVLCSFRPLTYLEGLLRRANNIGDMDKVFMLAVFLLAGRAADITIRYYSNKRNLSIDEEKLRTMHATVRSIQDSVFNTYNGFQLLIAEARATGVSEEVISETETSISRSVSKIRSLHEAREVCEKGLSSGTAYIDPRCPD